MPIIRIFSIIRAILPHPLLRLCMVVAELSGVEYLEAESCQKCDSASHPMWGIKGPGEIHILFVLQSSDVRVLEGDGYIEAFGASASGRTINAIVNGDWGGVALTNAVKCLFDVEEGGRQEPRPEEYARCSLQLRRQIEQLNPRFIITCGIPAVESVLGVGSSKPNPEIVLEQSIGDRTVLLGYHPRRMTRGVKEELRYLVTEIRHEFVSLTQEI